MKTVNAMARKSFAVSLTTTTLAGSIVLLGLLVWPAQTPERSTPEIATLSPARSIEPGDLHAETLEVRRRDTVLASLLRNDVPSVMAHAIAAALRKANANLRQVRPGDLLRLLHDKEGRLVTLAYAPSPWVRFEVTNSGSGWKGDRIEVEREVRIEARQGEVRNSLWDAVESGAVAPKALLDFVQIFESEFDFTANAQQGDLFRFLIETRYANGVRVDQGRILAAQYLSDMQTLTAVGFQDQNGFAYYDPQGRSLKKVFLRSPLQFTRISSGFTYRRPHPVLGGVRPHLAIDYAAPAGTPVWAVADGIVQFAGRNGGNGVQVVVRHRGGYKTYYNHLSRIARGLRNGTHVSQKQVIGYVGSTGLSTGPHLDYRVSHNGTFINPLSERFLPGDPIANTPRKEFLEYASALVERLDQEAPFRR